MNKINVSGNETAFKKEWKRFLREHDYKGTDDALDHEELLTTFRNQASTISRFCSGSRPLSADNLTLFAKLFGVREAYLSGKDPYRTQQDLALATKKKETIDAAFHTLFMNLGYADLHTTDTDYNRTFPPNTQIFIESMKQALADAGRDLRMMVDVDADRFVPLSPDAEQSLKNEILDFIRYKLDRLLNGAGSMEVPTCILEDGSQVPHPHTRLPLMDGSSLSLDFNYTPTTILLNSKNAENIEPEIHIDIEEQAN